MVFFHLKKPYAFTFIKKLFFGTIVILFETFVSNYTQTWQILRVEKSGSEKCENILKKV